MSPLWTPTSMRTRISFRGWAMPATGCSVRNRAWTMGRLTRRFWITLGLVGMLGACAQPGGDTGLQSAAKPGDGDALRYFEPEFSALLDLVVDGLGRACAG